MKGREIVRQEDIANFQDRELPAILLQLIFGSLDLAEGEAGLMRLTRGQRALYLVSLFDGEVRNGGFHQYFSNSSGDYASLTAGALSYFGATEAASLLREGMRRFPDGNPSSERNERDLELSELGIKSFSDLDAKYNALLKTSEAPWSKVVASVTAKRADFVG